jgi:hypothetical protein
MNWRIAFFIIDQENRFVQIDEDIVLAKILAVA